MVLHFRLRKICPTLCSANFSLIEKLSFGSQELPKRVLNFEIRRALKKKLQDLKFDLGIALQKGRMQGHLGCWQRDAGSALCQDISYGWIHCSSKAGSIIDLSALGITYFLKCLFLIFFSCKNNQAEGSLYFGYCCCSQYRAVYSRGTILIHEGLYFSMRSLGFNFVDLSLFTCCQEGQLYFENKHQ